MLSFLSSLRAPALHDAPGAAAALSAAGYVSVAHLAVLRGAGRAYLHDTLRDFGVGDHFSQARIINAIEALPPPGA